MRLRRMCRPLGTVALLLMLAGVGAGAQAHNAAYLDGFGAGMADARANLPPNPHKFTSYLRGDVDYQHDFTAGYTDGYIKQNPAALGWTLPGGTQLFAILDQQLDVLVADPFDPVQVTITAPATDAQGRVMIPAGAIVRGHTEEVVRATARAGTTSVVLRFDQLELPGKSTIRLVAHVEAVDVAHTHVHPNQSRVTGHEYGPRRAPLIGAVIGGIFGGLIARRAGAKNVVAFGTLGALVGLGVGSWVHTWSHDPTLTLPYGAHLTIRTDLPTTYQPYPTLRG